MIFNVVTRISCTNLNSCMRYIIPIRWDKDAFHILVISDDKVKARQIYFVGCFIYCTLILRKSESLHLGFEFKHELNFAIHKNF